MTPSKSESKMLCCCLVKSAQTECSDLLNPSMHVEAMLQSSMSMTGDLSRIQQQAGSSGRGLAPGALLGVGLGSRGGLGQGRAHLEANMAAALALQSPHEYKRWLGTYASHLSGETSWHRISMRSLSNQGARMYTASPRWVLLQRL